MSARNGEGVKGRVSSVVAQTCYGIQTLHTVVGGTYVIALLCCKRL